MSNPSDVLNSLSSKRTNNHLKLVRYEEHKKRGATNLTEERTRKGVKNSKKLTKIVTWSLENKSLWNKLCCYMTDDITVEDASILLDECKHHGFMELYYLLLVRVGEIIEINIHDPRFIKFIKYGLHKDITLNMNELKKIQSDEM